MLRVMIGERAMIGARAVGARNLPAGVVINAVRGTLVGKANEDVSESMPMDRIS